MTPRLRIRKGPADRYAGPLEAIYEVSIGDKGGLISINMTENGPVIDLYNFDPEVTIRAPKAERSAKTIVMSPGPGQAVHRFEIDEHDEAVQAYCVFEQCGWSSKWVHFDEFDSSYYFSDPEAEAYAEAEARAKDHLKEHQDD